jgi:hypothetical protein
LFAAPTWVETLRRQESPLAVWHSGRIVATTALRRTLRPGPSRSRRGRH